MKLCSCPKKCHYAIEALPDFPLFNSMGLKVGQKVYICGRGFLGGPTIIKHKDRHYAIGKEYAQEIVVSEVKEDELLSRGER